MKHITREIVTAYIVSTDHMLLLGRKAPGSGGVYADCLHNPGGGVDAGESLVAALKREVLEETGLRIADDQVVLIDNAGNGKAVKTINAEEVMVMMHFNVYRVQLKSTHEAAIVQQGDDLIDFEWYPVKDILTLPLTPPAFELFDRIGSKWLNEGK